MKGYPKEGGKNAGWFKKGEHRGHCFTKGEMLGEKNHFWGKKHTEESKKLMRESIGKVIERGEKQIVKHWEGKKLTIEHKNNIGLGLKNFNLPRWEKRQCACGCGIVFDVPKVSKQKCIAAHRGRGRISWNKGLTKDTDPKGRIKTAWSKGLTKETDKRIMKTANKMKMKWQEPGYKERVIPLVIQGSHIKPNKSELKLNSILEKLLPDNYVLNVKGEIMILGGRVPDFVNVNGQKKVIELNGEWWHSPGRRTETPEERIEYFKKFGWSTLIVWEKELKDQGLLKERILNFHFRE